MKMTRGSIASRSIVESIRLECFSFAILLRSEHPHPSLSRSAGEGQMKSQELARALVQRIEQLGIVKEHLVRQRPGYIFARMHGGHQLAFFRRILMAVVGADD